MSSSKAEPGGALGFVAEEIFAFDPDEVLVREPGLLLDPRFLSALQDELEQEMGADEARITLLQMGFLHGLRDAALVVERSLGAAHATSPSASPLPLQVRLRTDATGLELDGVWPERNEASMRLARHGVASEPSCALSAGYTSGWLSGLFDTDLLAVETTCAARGDEGCSFLAREVDAWAAADDAAVDELLGALPFAAMRKIVQREVEQEREEPRQGPDPSFTNNEPVVHIWGPVMVIPFGGADEGLRAVDLIARDPGASNVSVVVVDLSGALIDEAFGAVALERIIESIESWGAEAILACASPLSEPVVADLERAPLMVHKDLAGAVAAAFRIAESQRTTL